jgi:hypothetical protein
LGEDIGDDEAEEVVEEEAEGAEGAVEAMGTEEVEATAGEETAGETVETAVSEDKYFSGVKC